MRLQNSKQFFHIQSVMFRRESRQIILRQEKQPHCRPQPPPVFRMFRVLEIFLQVDECPGRLDQAFEKIVVGRVFIQPDLLEDVVRLVVMPVVPALEICPVKGVIADFTARWICIVSNELAHEPRNPLAFVHQELNVVPALIMSKPAGCTEDKRMHSGARAKE